MPLKRFPCPILIRPGPALQGQIDRSRSWNFFANAPPPVFPSLKLQGLVLNGLRSHAMINGTILFVGDRIGSVLLAGVEADLVTVEMGGQTRVLRLVR